MRILVLCLPLIIWASTARAALPDFRDLVRDVSPSVVNISTDNAVPETAGDPRIDELPDIFRDFFGNVPGMPRGGPQPGPRGGAEPQYLGSGFIISEDG